MNYPVEIKNKDLLDNKCFINGEWVSSASEETLEVNDPATGTVIGTIPFMKKAETIQAIESAQRVYPRWSAYTALQRADMLLHWYDRIHDNLEDLASILTSENGKPLAESRGEIRYAASFLRWFAEEGRRAYGRTIPQQKADTRMVVINQPIGVTAAITPWNFPAAMITRKLAPALAAGCPMIIKPSEFTPYTAIALVKLAEQVGFSQANDLPGIIQVITGDAALIGEALCAHPAVKKLSLTGSTRVGKILMRQSADHIKKLSLELGGNAPFIVFEDADLDAAVAGALICKYRNGGQTCVCANRIFAHKKIYGDFVEKLGETVSRLKVGAGFSEGAEIGPLINKAAFEKVAHHLTDATQKGAKVVTGGKPHDLGGTFYQPTVLRDIPDDAAIHKEETFGPLGGVIEFRDEAEVLARANDTEFGLAAYFYTRDIGRVWRVAEQLESGIVGINDGLISYEVAPFGGVKQSGLGREGGSEGLMEYMQTKYVLMGGITP